MAYVNDSFTFFKVVYYI